MRHIKSSLTSVVTLALFLILTGCGVHFRPRADSSNLVEFRLQIRSNTSWTAVLDQGRSVNGSRNATIDLTDRIPPVCVVVRNRTEEGYIRARVTPGGQWIETHDPNRSITVCSDG